MIQENDDKFAASRGTGFFSSGWRLRLPSHLTMKIHSVAGTLARLSAFVFAFVSCFCVFQFERMLRFSLPNCAQQLIEDVQSE